VSQESAILAVIDPGSPRAPEWVHVFGSTHAPLVSAFPLWASVPGHPRALCYLLDLDRLDEGQRSRLAVFLSGRFEVPLAAVRAALDAGEAVPILAEDVSVSLHGAAALAFMDSLADAAEADPFGDDDDSADHQELGGEGGHG
jgi:hypothetical protein